MTRTLRFSSQLFLLATLALGQAPVFAQRYDCLPCAGIRITDPSSLPSVAAGFGSGLTAATMESSTEDTGADPSKPTVFVAWRVPLTADADVAAANALAAAGATPLVSLVFTTPAPLTSNLDALQGELEQAARLAGALPAGSQVQVVWEPGPTAPVAGADAPGADAFATVAAEQAASDLANPAKAPEAAPPTWAADYAFLLKRAAVAVGGAQPTAQIVTQPLAADPTTLRSLYAADIAAYIDVVALAPANTEAVRAVEELLIEVDPGRPLIVDGTPLPTPAPAALLDAARNASAGAALTLFATASADSATLAPFVVLAQELAGDLSYDATSAPSGSGETFAFVRGKDLGLRVIAGIPEAERGDARLVFPGGGLEQPRRIDLTTGKVIAISNGRNTGEGFEIRISPRAPAALVALDRAAASELEGVQGVAEQVTIAGERQMPVEEILRRLQAFEDAQSRKLDHYQAKRTTHLRFVAGGTQSVEASFEGTVFFEQGKGFDWAWEHFYFNGVEWRGKKIPEIPLVQPEKAAVMPVEVTFGKTYTYRLRGTDTVDGRDCWVIDFEPVDRNAAEAEKLYQGTVWVDRAIYARVRTRALQLGLTGQVLSNEETLTYSPVDAQGRPAPWSPAAFVMPLSTSGQQILSVLNVATVVERGVELAEVRINGEGFAAAREQLQASDVTMVRDTDEGLRYLVKDDSGSRVVKEGFDQDKLFALAGTFYDDSQDYPLPLLGLNYFSLDFRHTGAQANLFFGGVLAIGNLATPSLFGSKWDAGVDLFGIAIATSDEQYRDGEENKAERIESRPVRLALNLGHPLGAFGKLDLGYNVEYRTFSRADETDDTFVLPQDTLTHSMTVGTSFARQGYRLGAEGRYSTRADWQPWGLPGNPELDDDQKSYAQWRGSAAKNWYFKNFQKVGVELDYLGGRHLDRFSKYEFGFFGDSRVKGFSGGKVRAEEAWLAHLDYGFEIGSVFRVSASLDGALATDQASGLDQEPLVGIGLGGTVMGPWETIVNFDVGTPVAGPDDGVVLYLVFLKLFG
jgi:hypothetical protein